MLAVKLTRNLCMLRLAHAVIFYDCMHMQADWFVTDFQELIDELEK